MKIKRTRIITVETHSVTISAPVNSENAGAKLSPAFVDCQFAVVARETDRPQPSLIKKTKADSRLRRVMQRIWANRPKQ